MGLRNSVRKWFEGKKWIRAEEQEAEKLGKWEVRIEHYRT